MTRLRFGVVGCGAIVTVHQLPALRRCRRLDLVAVTDVDAAWAATVARRAGVPASYGDHRALIGKVDAALVATPNTTHADIACELLAHGVHVLCEKPMGTTTAEVDRILATAARSGTRVMAAHCGRFNANAATLRELIADGALGRLREITGGIGGGYDPGRTDFRRRRSLSGGGVLIDIGIHLIDLALWLTGDTPRAIDCRQSSLPGWEVEAEAEVRLEFGDGASATLESSFCRSVDCRVGVRGDAGWTSMPLYDPTRLTVFSEQARACRRDGAQELLLPAGTMYERQIDHFCEAVLFDAPFLVDGAEVRAGIDVIERCYRRAA